MERNGNNWKGMDRTNYPRPNMVFSKATKRLGIPAATLANASSELLNLNPVLLNVLFMSCNVLLVHLQMLDLWHMSSGLMRLSSSSMS
jgi:hypothetical protein